MLLKAILSGDNSTFDFVRKSRCGPVNEDQQHPRVCCGKYGGKCLGEVYGKVDAFIFVVSCRKFLMNQFVFVACDVYKDYD